MSFGFKNYAKRTVVDGIAFPSRLEASLYSELAIEKRQGIYVELSLQCRVDPEACPHCGIREAKPTKVDFRTTDAFGNVVYHEAKGLQSDRWREFVAWWRRKGPAPLRIYRDGGGCRARMVEEIVPPR